MQMNCLYVSLTWLIEFINNLYYATNQVLNYFVVYSHSLSVGSRFGCQSSRNQILEQIYESFSLILMVAVKI